MTKFSQKAQVVAHEIRKHIVSGGNMGPPSTPAEVGLYIKEETDEKAK